MSSPSKPPAFLSYTSEFDKFPGQRTFIDEALEGVQEAGYAPMCMRDYPPKDLPAADEDEKRVKACDVYIGVFGFRYGTPVRGLEELSYTQHEFEVASQAGKPRLVLLLDEKALVPSMFHDDESELLDRQKGFRRRVENEADLIVRRFDSPQSLRDWIVKGLNELDRHVPEPYRRWLLGQNERVDLFGLKRREGDSIRLREVYVPLVTSDLPREQMEAVEEMAEERTARGARDKDTHSLLLNLLGERSLYVSGNAGTGKSTFCRWLAMLACHEELPPPQVPGPEEFRENFPDSLRRRLPLLVRLREFWREFLPAGPDRDDLSRPEFEHCLEQWLTAKPPDGLLWRHVKAHLENGTALLIFDGMDEVPASYEVRDGAAAFSYFPRQMLVSALAEAAPYYEQRGNRLLVTSRPYGLVEDDVRKLGLRHARIADLPKGLQRLLVERWFHILERDAAEGAVSSSEMLAQLNARDYLRPMASNPLLLTAMCVLFRAEGKKLPQDQHELYDRIVVNVLASRFGADNQKHEQVRRRLGVVAYGMHTGEVVDPGREDPQAQATYDEIEQWLAAFRQRSRYTESGADDAAAQREELLARSGLLIERDAKQAGFYHLSIQEFLAAERLRAVCDDQGVDLLQEFYRRSRSSNWRDTLVFVFAALAGLPSTEGRSFRLFDGMIETVASGADDAMGLLVVAAHCTQIFTGRGICIPDDHRGQLVELFMDAIRREVSLPERFQLGLAMGELGDPRIVQDLREPAAYVEIPAGTYPLGDKKERWELQQPFLLSKYPVTNSQYRLFIEEAGYDERRWWSEEGWRWREKEGVIEPRLWRDSKWNNPSQPVVAISYREAEAFANWAGGRLPTEQEWESAARGPRGLYYPWGEKEEWQDGICNSQEADLGVTSPVGLFPRSTSKDFGLEDMAGNVWEWCQGRVLRGGAFYGLARIVRAACRGVNHPGNRDLFTGFRLART